MNVPESVLGDIGYTAKFSEYESLFDQMVGPAQSLICIKTRQTVLLSESSFISPNIRTSVPPISETQC
jgi:hypothetical protein